MRKAVDRALDLVGLSGYGARYPSDLSGDQQQRVELAHAAVSRPRLLLFDEPLSNLDAQLRVRLRSDLRRVHWETRHTAVYVTYDQSEALALADRIAVMREERIEQLGTAADIFLTPATHYVAKFVGFENFAVAHVVGDDPQGIRLRPFGWSGVDLWAHRRTDLVFSTVRQSFWPLAAATQSYCGEASHMDIWGRGVKNAGDILGVPFSIILPATAP